MTAWRSAATFSGNGPSLACCFLIETLIARLPLERTPSAELERGYGMLFRQLLIEGTPGQIACGTCMSRSADPRNNEASGRLRTSVHSSIRKSRLMFYDEISEILFADRAETPTDLIRVVMAVESQPAVNHFAALGMDPRKIPTGFNVPAGTPWPRLMIWLLSHGTELPGPAIRDVVALCQNWALAYGGRDPLSPTIARWFNYWRTQVDKPLDTSVEAPQAPFGGTLTPSKIWDTAWGAKDGFPAVLLSHA